MRSASPTRPRSIRTSACARLRASVHSASTIWCNGTRADTARGPVLSLPIFDGGRLRAQYRGSEAQLDAAIASYNDTVLHAVEQTADQITRLDALASEQRDQQQTLEANEAAYKLAEERYRAGLASYLSVLNAETQVLAARQTMVDILGEPGGCARDDAPGGGRQLRSAHRSDIASELLTRVSP